MQMLGADSATHSAAFPGRDGSAGGRGELPGAQVMAGAAARDSLRVGGKVALALPSAAALSGDYHSDGSDGGGSETAGRETAGSGRNDNPEGGEDAAMIISAHIKREYKPNDVSPHLFTAPSARSLPRLVLTAFLAHFLNVWDGISGTHRVTSRSFWS